MYPYPLLFGITLYDLSIALGAAGALLLFRLLSDKLRLSAKKTNLALVGGIAGIVFGLFTAVLVQAFYNFMAGEAFGFSAYLSIHLNAALVKPVHLFKRFSRKSIVEHLATQLRIRRVKRNVNRL